MRLAADCHSQGQVLHAVSDVAISKELLTQLDLDMETRQSSVGTLYPTNLLQEKSLDCLLI